MEEHDSSRVAPLCGDIHASLFDQTSKNCLGRFVKTRDT